MTQTRRHLLLLSLLAASALTGCFHKSVRVIQGRPDHLTLLVDLASSVNAPLGVDVLTIADQPTLDQLLTMTAQDWFANGNDFARRHAGKVRVTHFDFTPGQAIAPINIDKTATASGVLLFAHYSTPGEHRTVLPIAAIVRLQCDANNFSIQILP